MEEAEIPTMIAALALMFAAIGVKVVTAQMVARMKNQITHVGHIKQEVLNRLKIAQSQNAVNGQNKVTLIAKKTKILKRLNRLKGEMTTLEQDDEARKQRSSVRKVEK